MAPNIYFLGFAGVIKFGNIRIGGLSGIYKEYDYHKGTFLWHALIASYVVLYDIYAHGELELGLELLTLCPL